VFFRAADMGEAFTMLHAMFTPSGLHVSEAVSASLTNTRTFVLLLALLVVLLPGSFVLGRVLEAGRTRGATVTRFAVMAFAGPYAAVLVAAGTFSPFLYYQF
jgi:alginate O-acetyltransferase complex protein AlgI